MITVLQIVEEENIDKALKLAYKQKQITHIFGLEAINGIGIGLQIALLLAKKGEYRRVKIELDQVLDILGKYPKGIANVREIEFFKYGEFEAIKDNNASFQNYGYSILLDQIFQSVGENYDLKDIKYRLEKEFL